MLVLNEASVSRAVAGDNRVLALFYLGHPLPAVGEGFPFGEGGAGGGGDGRHITGGVDVAGSVTVLKAIGNDITWPVEVGGSMSILQVLDGSLAAPVTVGYGTGNGALRSLRVVGRKIEQDRDLAGELGRVLVRGRTWEDDIDGGRMDPPGDEADSQTAQREATRMGELLLPGSGEQGLPSGGLACPATAPPVARAQT